MKKVEKTLVLVIVCIYHNYDGVSLNTVTSHSLSFPVFCSLIILVGLLVKILLKKRKVLLLRAHGKEQRNALLDPAARGMGAAQGYR